MTARLVAQHGAPQLHGLAQGGAEVPPLVAVQDGRQLLLAALLQLDLPVSDCSKDVLLFSLSLYFTSYRAVI